MLNLGFTIQIAGELLIAVMVLRVHHRVLHEHKMDKKVFATMKREQLIGYIGVACLVVGYLVQVMN
jgi:hypothetical protein